MKSKRFLYNLAFHLPVLLLTIVMIYPLVWMVASSLKENSQVFTQAHSLACFPPHWENYVKGWKSSGNYTYATYFTNPRRCFDVVHLHQLPDDVSLFFTQSVASLPWHNYNASCVYSITEDALLQKLLNRLTKSAGNTGLWRGLNV